MKALILAAGYGTRLYPLTKAYPKPLLPVAQRPILDYIAEKLAKVNAIEEIIIITNDKFYKNFLEWAKKFKASALEYSALAIKVINDGTKSEHDRLGAIGDIQCALRKDGLQHDILIFGGDNLFEESMEGFIAFALNKKPHASIGVYDIGEKELATKFGVVSVDTNNKIIDFAEKPSLPQSSLIATCLYYIPREKLKYFEEYARDLHADKDTSGSFIRWLSNREEVYGFVFNKHWYDIGDPQSYQEADKAFANFRKGER
mgnify:CR=1 FL=1